MVNFWFLSFLSEPWFVIPWYGLGSVAMMWVLHDEYADNTAVNEAVKWAWPVIVFFFSVLGLAFYLLASRPPKIQDVDDDRKEEVFSEYASNPLRKVTGAVIHCVGGDGLGVVTTDVVSAGPPVS